MGKSGVDCTGCGSGVNMCHHRPCLGTPEEFEAIIDAGYADKLRIDFWAGAPLNTRVSVKDLEESRGGLHYDLTKLIYDYQQANPNPFTEDVLWLSGGTANDGNFRASFSPGGTCNFLTPDEKCELHELGLKPEQGRESCCMKEKDTAKENLHYAHLWDTPKGKEVLEKFKKAVNLKLD